MKQKAKLPEIKQPTFQKILAAFGIRERTLSYSGDNALISQVGQEVAKSAIDAVKLGLVDTSKFDSIDHSFYQATPSRYVNFQLTDAPFIGGIYSDLSSPLDRRVDVIASTETHILATQISIKELFGYRYSLKRNIRLTPSQWMARRLVMVGRLGCQIRFDENGIVQGVGSVTEQTLFTDVIQQINTYKLSKGH